MLVPLSEVSEGSMVLIFQVLTNGVHLAYQVISNYFKMNISKTKFILIILFLSTIYSCNKKEELENGDITVSESNRYISTAKRIVVYTSSSFTDGDKSDTFKIKFSDKDWVILQKSF